MSPRATVALQARAGLVLVALPQESIQPQSSVHPRPLPSAPTLTESFVTADTSHHSYGAFTPDHKTEGRLEQDILPQIPGMFRLLDLYSETGSGGLVDKVLIDQQGLQSLINNISPGSYHSITRIDFANLNLSLLKVIGVYGSKSEIVRFLQSLGVIDVEIAKNLNRTPDEQSLEGPSLRSGLYFVFPTNGSVDYPDPSTPREAYVIYWPEETTWDDKAVGAVRKNRVTFIRYLTCLCDQITVLVSPEHGSKLIWESARHDGDQDDDEAEEDDPSGADPHRFFEFEVVVKKEEEEGISLSPGFTVPDSQIRHSARPSENGPSDYLEPKLVASECRLAYLTGRSYPAELNSRDMQQNFTRVGLSSKLRVQSAIYIADTVSLEGVRLLLEEGELRLKAPKLCKAWSDQQSEIKSACEREYQATSKQLKGENSASRARLELAIRAAVSRDLASYYNPLDASSLYGSSSETAMTYSQALDHLKNLILMCPSLRTVLPDDIESREMKVVQADEYKILKHRFIEAKRLITRTRPTPQKCEEIIQSITVREPEEKVAASPWLPARLLGVVAGAFRSTIGAPPATPKAQLNPLIGEPSHPDHEFINGLAKITDRDPRYQEAAQQLVDLVSTWAKKKVDSLAPSIARKASGVVERMRLEQAKLDRELKTEAEISRAFVLFRDPLRQAIAPRAGPGFHIKKVEKTARQEIAVDSRHDTPSDPYVEYRLHVLELTQDDKQGLRENPQFVPKPQIQSPVIFSLGMEDTLKHLQLLGANRCLLIVDSPKGLAFYLTETHALSALRRPTKQLPTSVRGDMIFAVDEAKRLLAMVITESGRLTLQLFSFDETFSSIHSRGSPLPINQWYQGGLPNITAACFLSGTEDLCLLEKSGRIRTFSFMSQAFRPAAFQASNTPVSMFSSPDGSALLVVEAVRDDEYLLRAFHKTTRRSSNLGIVAGDGSLFRGANSFSITSLENRSNAHVLSLSLTNRSLSSVALRISNNSTDYHYQSKNAGVRQPKEQLADVKHNSLINCMADVWTRYPVVPAIERELVSSETRLPQSITFVTGVDQERFLPYFKWMIREFESSTRKPTNHLLDGITVQSKDFNHFITTVTSNDTNASYFRAGEWIVELLCLIPIHIAVARENRFVPLNNGVIDPGLEQRLLGAEVSQIVDALTLGWYESIFNSYMATKPVKVISSMGEQSVGKSYALNHIIDSSFAGSAVRTTEGVWLSLCPTRDLLIVALDFEGVHSIERTPQEDMLLVLFNTAISNMVLFRNNFALSRDVANMFTSFQSSTSLLDPASNPQLFKGLLVVIIKDVVQADIEEIVKEFNSKFSQIVTEEQGTNFITVLHDSQNIIIPWPVIQSRQFYTLFSKLKKRFLAQRTTHKTAGEFLLTLKTLMAKLKAQDWGALDQNLTKYRVASISSLLPTAIATGFAELEPEPEPLRSLDNQLEVPSHGDTPARFCIDRASADCQGALKRLVSQWSKEAARRDISELDKYLQSLVQVRILHVGEWVNNNLARFSPESADVRALKRQFDDACEKLRSSVSICRAECSSCRLPCLLNKSHEEQDHDCGTSHKCLDNCGFLDVDHHVDNRVQCGLPAGHTGRHMCDPSAHCCGRRCDLSENKGCQKSCMKPAEHPEEEHMCSARTHHCGQPCDLKNVQGSGATIYSCPNHCTLPHDEPHEVHTCGDSLSCPIRCELCPRLCAMGDHFHALEKDAIHLCGQEHPCAYLCAESGICEINTAPRSVETTFVGVYERFQYTKYTQVAKRLPCAIVLQPGERNHAGAHVHNTAQDAFHYCEADCPSCGYICTLPLGHAQPEHETAHGSMDNTAWAIQGADDACVEVQGHKYAPEDTGAPNMCHVLCSNRGRHVHIAYCRAGCPEDCQEEGSEHITTVMVPNPERAKDWVSHALFWKRTGFRDPYSRDDQAEFSRCDFYCPGPEHDATATQSAQPSLCTLPIFHPPQPSNWALPNRTGVGYVSSDGHAFSCANPASLRQAFHVLFVLDKSTSMRHRDRQPLPDTPFAPLIRTYYDNRFGAVLSALELFWSSRNIASGSSRRRDAYSVITFNDNATVIVENDFDSTSERLLGHILRSEAPQRGTNFDDALHVTRLVMERRWDRDLSPVVIFLSDGECRVDDTVIYDLCNSAVARGKPLSFHSVSFGDNRYTVSLERMVSVAKDVNRNTQGVPSSFTDAVDTIQLAETFMTISQSLQKPRASLIRT